MNSPSTGGYPDAVLEALPTPSLAVDQHKLSANIERMRGALEPHGVDFRPHMKTAKSIEIAALLTKGWSGAITVSTLREAETFAAAGYSDILYAVGITKSALPRVERMLRRGSSLKVVIDSLDAALAVSDFCRTKSVTISALIEIDSDGHRGGISPADTASLLNIGMALHSGGAALLGVMTHAGGSYELRGEQALSNHAELERFGAVRAAETLRGAGLPCPIVSVGSTPTALCARALQGVTEVRAGVFGFFDLVMAGIGVCQVSDIALSVITRVIGHQRERNHLIIDAGWMALSRDRGTQGQLVDQGYGLVGDVNGMPIDDLVVRSTNQEHGIVGRRDGGLLDMDKFPLGTVLRILPNHACSTAAQHDEYLVMDGAEVTAVWPRFRGW